MYSKSSKKSSSTYSFIKLILLIIPVIFLSISAVSNLRDYNLIYFKYGPGDLLVKVFVDNENYPKAPENTDYIIPKIENGEANIFLLNKFKNEREYVTYKYKVIFYKTQIINDKEINVPVYSFKIRFNGDNTIVQYEPSKALPKDIKDNNLEKVFYKSPGSNKYFLKDYNNDDFLLGERMRPVKFTGIIKKDKGQYIDMNKSDDLYIKLIKISDDNTTDKNIYSEEEVIEIPLNKEITVGLAPYIFEDADVYNRLSIDKILVQGIEQDKFYVHFAEVWNNMYEQKLVFKDDGYYIDFRFDPDLYDLNYVYDDENIVRQVKSPLSVSILKNKGKIITLNLSAKNIAVKYLDNPTQIIKYKIDENKNAIESIKEININYMDNTKILEDNSLQILPNFKKFNFAVFSTPGRAKIMYKKIEPISKDDLSNDYIDLGEAPVYLKNINYGRYSVKAEWYDKEVDKTDITKFTSEQVVEFSDSKELNEYKNNIKFLTRNNISIPYISFDINDVEISKTNDNNETITYTETNTVETGDDISENDNPDLTGDEDPVVLENKVIDSEAPVIVDNSGNLYTEDSSNDAIKDSSADQAKIKNEEEIETVNKKTGIDNTSENNSIINEIFEDTTVTDTKKEEKSFKIETKKIEQDKTILKTETVKPKLIEKSNTKKYYVQIFSFRENKYTMQSIYDDINLFIKKYENKNKKTFSVKTKIFKKTVNDKKYNAVVIGPYSLTDAKKIIKDILKIETDAFIEYDYKYEGKL